MSPEQQRISIAEFCGWRMSYKSPCLGFPPKLNPNRDCPRLLPDYLHDLNAMHEAECALPERVRNFQYLQCLGIMCEPGRHPIHATAAQRAEALLRTIGKWVEPKP